MKNNLIVLLSTIRGEGEDDKAFNQEHVDAAVAKAIEQATSDTAGLKTKNEELLNENSVYKKTAKQWDGMNFDEVSNMMKMFSNNEEAQLIKDGKFEDVITKRMDKVNTEHATALSALQESNDSLTADRDSFKSKYQNKFIDDAIADVAAKAGVIPEALSDIRMHGRNAFTIDSEGEIVALDKDGGLVKTESGDLLTPERFIEVLKKSSPYYWPKSESGNLGGDNKDADDLSKRIQEAAASGDMETYKKLRAKMK